MTESTQALLTERGNRYGRFEDNADISQLFKQVLRQTDNWHQLSVSQREALDQICCKISRIFSGDVDYVDNWADIAGYATLAVNDIDERCTRVTPAAPMQADWIDRYPPEVL